MSSSDSFTVLTRVASIPLVSSSLSTLHSTLSNNPYTRSPYSAAHDLSSSAYRLSAPLQLRLAPLISRADGYANKGLDAVESRYPYPFTASPQEIADYVKQTRDNAVAEANKTIDQRVKSPAIHVAQDIDQRFTPFVDYFEVAVQKLNPTPPSSPHPDAPAQYQYQRAYALTHSLAQGPIASAQSAAHRASTTATALSNTAHSSLAAAQARVQALSDRMLAELQRLHVALASAAHSAAGGADGNSTASTSTADSNTGSAIQELTALIGARVQALGAIAAGEGPLNEKLARAVEEVRVSVSPLLGRVRGVLGLGTEVKEETKTEGTGTQTDEVKTNGSGNGAVHDADSE